MITGTRLPAMPDPIIDPIPPRERNDASRPTTATLPILALLLGAIIMVAVILTVAAHRYDDADAERSYQRVQRALNSAEQSLATTTRDYAGWDAAVNHLIERFDALWADENIGIYLNGAYRVSVSILMDRQHRVTYAIRDGKRLTADRTALLQVPPSLEALVSKAESLPGGVTESVTGIVKMADGIYLAAAADIRPGLGGPLRADGKTLIFMQRLDRAMIARFLEALMLDNMDMPSRAVANSSQGLYPLMEFAVAPANAPPVAWISWRLADPAQSFLRSIYWALILVIAVLLALTGHILLKAQRTARQDARMKAALRRAYERYRTLIDSLPDMVCVLRDGRVTLINRAGLALLGCEGAQEREIIGRPFLDLIAEKDRLAFHRRVQAGGKQLRLDWTALRLNGQGNSLIPIELALLSTPTDPSEDMTLVARDQRPEVANLETLRAAEARAAMADRAKGQFLANISHELRTPLNAIIGFSEILRDELLGALGAPQYREYANDIHEGGLHLLRLVNDLLDIARMDAGTLELRESWVDINALIERCERMLRQKAADRGVPMNVDISPSGLRLYADEIRMKQIIVNLVGNAIRFSESGQRVDVRIRLDGINGDLLLDVADHGIGMTVEAMRLALEPFSQVESGHNRRQAGAGLGLPLAKGYVEAHGGVLTMESTPAVGTVVTVRLPAFRVAVAPVAVTG